MHIRKATKAAPRLQRSARSAGALRQAGVLLASSIALSACSFLLDFDELSAGDEQAAGGTAGTGSGGSGATDGGSACGVCDDKDPCTVDLCDTSGDQPRCVFEPQTLVPDGMSVTQEFDEVHHLNLVSAGGRFYLSTFAREGATDDVTLWTFGRDGDQDQFKAGARFSQLVQGTPLQGKLPASGAGLLAKVLGFKTQIYVALAVRDAANLDANVYLVGLDEEFKPLDDFGQLSQTRTFAVPDLKRQPILWETNSIINVGWLTRVGAVFFPLVDNGTTYVVTAANAQAIAPIDNAQVPGVLVVSDNSVTTQLADKPEALVENCIGKGMPITRAGSARISLNFWYTWWSRASGQGAASDIASLACGQNACAADRCGKGDRDHDASDGVRNPDYAVVVRETTPDLLTLVGAVPSVQGERAKLDLTLNTVRLSGGTTQPVTSTSVQLVDEATSQGSGGPDYPRIAVSGEDRLAVAWLETAGSKAQLRVERYRMCYPAE